MRARVPSVDLRSLQQRRKDDPRRGAADGGWWQAVLRRLQPSEQTGAHCGLGESGGSPMVTLNLREPLSPVGVRAGYPNGYFPFL